MTSTSTQHSTKEDWESVEIELEETEFNRIATLAHEKDITFNEMCNIILAEAIEKYEEKQRASEREPSDSELTSSKRAAKKMLSQRRAKKVARLSRRATGRKPCS